MKTRTANRYSKRPKLSQAERQALQAEALDRAQNGRVCANDMLILAEFGARGIDAHPRVDVFTFNAWKALHRHVRKGEHGVHVPVYVHTTKENDDGTTEEHTIPTGATVFHVSQTDPDEPRTPAAIEAETLEGIEATQRQDIEADEREQAEDDREAAILEQEQNDERRQTAENAGPELVIIDPLTGATLRTFHLSDVATPDTRPEVTTTADEQPGLF
jgi:hypothetical protein